MAEQHARAVQKMRRQFSHQLDYDILLIIALDTGRDGAAATTSYRGIAERANCHYNTVTGHIDRLKEAGWITVEKQGKYMAYRLQIDVEMGSNIVTNDCDNVTKIVTSNCDNYQELSQRLSQLEQTLSQRLSQLEAMIVTAVKQGDVTEDSEEKSEDKSEDKNTPPTPQGVGDGVNFEAPDLETEFWGKAQTLVSEWQGLIGDYRPLDANRKQDKSDFFAPALRMINDFGGDYAAAWLAVRAERERMIRDGLGNVRKLSAVVTGVLATLERARLPELDPVHQNGNGRKLSNAEAGAVQYAALRQKLVRSKQ